MAAAECAQTTQARSLATAEVLGLEEAEAVSQDGYGQ